MKFNVPWHVKGVRPEARDSAHAAARQAGVSVGEWLNNVILESAGDDEPPRREPPRREPTSRPPPRREQRRGDYREASHEDSWMHHAPERPHHSGSRSQFERAGRSSTQPRRFAPEQAVQKAEGAALRQPIERNTELPAYQSTQQLAEALARLDKRMDEIIQERRAAPRAAVPASPPAKSTSITEAFSDLGREHARAVAGASDWGSNIDQAVAEISQRMRELDEEARTPVPPESSKRNPPPSAPPIPGSATAPLPNGIVEMQEQLRKITAQIQSLDAHRTSEAVAALRDELAGIARTLSDASPRRAIEALEGEVRALAVQLDATRRAANAPEFASLERGLAEVHDAVRTLAPAESLTGAIEAIHLLSTKIDQMAAQPRDNQAMAQLETAIAGLRGIAAHAASSEALAALTSEVRAIAAKVDNELPGVSRGNAILNSLDQRIATIADAIEQVRTARNEHAAPPEFDQALQSLGDRLERLYVAPGGRVEFAPLQDRLDQLVEKFEAAESRLRGLDTIEHGVKEVFSYLDEVRRKAAAPVALAAPASAIDPEILERIEQRFEQISQRFDLSDTRLRGLDTIERGIKELFASVDELRRNAEAARTAGPSTTGIDRETVQQLDRRIQGLNEKIETVVARTSGFEALERGMTAVLNDLREARIDGVLTTAAPTSSAMNAEPESKRQAPVEPAQDTIGDVADRLAMIEVGLRGGDEVDNTLGSTRSAQLAAVDAGSSRQPTTAATPSAGPASSRQVVVGAPDYDQPLEPGSGKPRPGLANITIPTAGTAKMASPPIAPEQPGPASVAERIAASKAVLESTKAAPVDAGSKPNYIVAARRAAQAAAKGEETPAQAASASETAPEAQPSGLRKHIKSALVGICILVILASAVHLVVNFFDARSPAPEPPKPQSALPAAPGPVSQSDQPAADDPERELIAKFIRPEDPTGGTAGVLPEPTEAPTEVQTPASSRPSAAPGPGAKIIQVPADSATLGQKPQAARESTGSVAPPVGLVSPPAGLFGPQQLAHNDTLPTTIGGSALIAAAQAGDPAAAYEIAVRFAEGKGVAVNTAEAAAWFEQAARAGVVPALFRLGGQYEKGLGVKKDIIRARSLYLAAANAGNAKSMHNLAVLYAEGIDGKPDYATAMQWFRKAANYGVADSQFNLGVLYARGIGGEQNLAEAFKWFALAAQQGDEDAAKKRDDIAQRLDPKTLNETRQGVQNWVAEQQPDEAVTVRAPMGGWDQSAAPASRKVKTSRL